MMFVFVIDRLIRHRACALKDTVHAIIRDELDEDFEKICAEIRESRSKRGFSVDFSVGSYLDWINHLQI